MFGVGSARTPRSKEVVTTSAEVLEVGRTVTFVARRSGSWVYLSGHETDDSEPLAVHFSHLAGVDPGLVTLRLRRCHYALRYDAGAPWHAFGPVEDDEMDRLLETGVVDAQRADIVAGSGDGA